jgi:SPX domain protein involved in polyphosphate accumulation
MELSETEISNIVGAFKELNVKPNLESPEDFISWMSDYHKSVLIQHVPKLSLFSGTANGATSFQLWQYEVQFAS